MGYVLRGPPFLPFLAREERGDLCEDRLPAGAEYRGDPGRPVEAACCLAGSVEVCVGVALEGREGLGGGCLLVGRELAVMLSVMMR